MVGVGVGANPGIPAFCVHKRPAVQGIARFFWRPSFILALGLARNSFGAPPWSQDQKTRSKDGDLAPSARVERRGVQRVTSHWLGGSRRQPVDLQLRSPLNHPIHCPLLTGFK